MTTDERDTNSAITKGLRKLAVDCVSKLREASDNKETCNPELVGVVQRDVFLSLSQVYYGFFDDV